MSHCPYRLLVTVDEETRKGTCVSGSRNSEDDFVGQAADYSYRPRGCVRLGLRKDLHIPLPILATGLIQNRSTSKGRAQERGADTDMCSRPGLSGLRQKHTNFRRQ